MFDIMSGDAVSMLSVIDKKVQMCITSPPYYNLRNYTNNIYEIGTEISIDHYINNLINVFEEVKKILLDNGTLYVNIGDTYNKKGSLNCIPDKFKISMVNNGWICRNEIIWHKPNAIPSSAKNRFTNDYEKMFMFTKKKKYMFNTQYEPRITKASNNSSITKESKYESVDQESSVRQGMNKQRGNKVIKVRPLLLPQDQFLSILKSKVKKQQLYGYGVKNTTIDHWFRKDATGFSYPKVEDWLKIRFLVDDWSEDFRILDESLTAISFETDNIDKNAHKGRIKRTTWSIPTKANPIKHFASYPEKLVLTPILASSNENDWVIDPFMGSGTTGFVALKNKRNFIGIDLSDEYCEYAKERLNKAISH